MRDHLLHLVVGFLVDQVHLGVGQLPVVLRVVVLKHDLDNVVNFDIHYILDDCAQQLHGLVRLVLLRSLFFLDDTAEGLSRTHASLIQINGLLLLELLQKFEQKERDLNFALHH